MKTKITKTIIILLCIFSIKTKAQTTADFENLSLAQDTFWNGSLSPLGTTFASGNVIMPNYYDTSFGGFWSLGWAYSNMKDDTTAGFGNLYSSIAGSGFLSSNNYIVGQNNAILKFNAAAQGKVMNGLYVSNSTYAALSMKNGDAFAKKFGGINGTDSDYFLLTIYGYLNGIKKADTFDYYLADYRFSDSAQDYINDGWTWLNLTSLGNVDSLEFKLSSSDNGAFGMNTPAFFCVDNIVTSDALLQLNENEFSKNSIQVFPNPAKEFLIVKQNGNQELKIELFNLTGQKIFSTKTNEHKTKINFNENLRGVYQLVIEGNNFKENKKIVFN